MAIVLNEPLAATCRDVLQSAYEICMSAATLTEVLIVAGRRNVRVIAKELIDDLSIDILPVTPSFAHRVADAYDRWGRGVDPASSNHGDCFSYETARSQQCPLLFVGDDISKTDIEPALKTRERKAASLPPLLPAIQLSRC